MPLLNATTADNGITVTQDGDYEINYKLVGQVDTPSTLTLSVAVDGVLPPSGTVLREFTAATENELVGSTIVSLTAGNVVTLQTTGSAATTFTPTDNVNSYLTVKKLNTGNVV